MIDIKNSVVRNTLVKHAIVDTLTAFSSSGLDNRSSLFSDGPVCRVKAAGPSIIP